MDYRKEIEEKGFLVLPNLITEQECDHYKSVLDNNYEIFAPNYAGGMGNTDTEHGLDNKSLEKVVYNLHNKDLSFFKLFEHPEVLKILDFMLLEGSYKDSEPYYLYNNCARCPLIGNPGQQLHSDSRLPGINYCIVANVDNLCAIIIIVISLSRSSIAFITSCSVLSSSALVASSRNMTLDCL